jgi:GDP-6-deoxy-D-talose 4-dehydrogenase
VASPSDRTSPARRVLVTGMGGFTGQYVAAELREAGYEVVGLSQATGAADATMHAVDLCDRHALGAFMAGQHFDAVVHLAAISFVAHGDADAIYRVNIVGTRNLLEALDSSAARPRIVVLASSANIYGNAAVEPITEATPPAPANDYAVSKLAMEHMAALWSDRLPITITRPFNYTGVGQGKQFLIPKIVDHYRRRETEIELGNTDVVRDFLDVRDVATLYRRIVEHAPAGQTINLCSGRGHSLQDVIDMAGQLAGYRIAVKVNPAFVRSNEVKRLVGSRSSLEPIAPQFAPRPLAETLAWMIRA